MKVIRMGGGAMGRGAWVNPPADKIEEVERTGHLDGMLATIIDACPNDHQQGGRCPDWPKPCSAP